MRNIIILLFISFGIASCNSKKTSDNPPVAKVNDSYLYLNRIKSIIPPNSSKEDSLQLSDNYIRQWITKQLLVSHAELNLDSKDQNFKEMVEDYRSSLIIHKYQEYLVKQKIDTLVSITEITNYYKKYPGNFILNRNIIKAVYIKVHKPVPDASKLRKLYKLKNSKDWNKLEDYCFQNATKFDNFNQKWIYSQELFNKTPIKISNGNAYLRTHKCFEISDSLYHYFINIQNYKLKNAIAPLSFVRNNIKKIIITKRRIQFIKNMEDNIYDEAESKNEFKIY